MLRLTLSPSYYLVILLSVIHGLAFISIGIIDVVLGIKISMMLLIAGSWLYYGRKALLLSPKTIVTIVFKEGGEIDLCSRDGSKSQGILMFGSYIHPWFSTICFQKDGKRFYQVIAVLPDMLPQEQFRQLRVWLKWKKLDDHSNSNCNRNDTVWYYDNNI